MPTCFLSSLCLNSLTNQQESRLQQPSLRANQDHGWLNHRAFSWSSEPFSEAVGQTCVSWLPVAPLKQEAALMRRDATCPWRPTDTISLQWYVACPGDIADRNRVLGTASYLIHWPTSDARLVLIKWLGEIWLRKAVMPSDSSRNLWTCVLLTLAKWRLCGVGKKIFHIYRSFRQYIGIRINCMGGVGGGGGQVHCGLVYMLMCTSLDIKRIMFSISVKYSSSFSFLVNKKMKTPGSRDGVFTENIPPLRILQCSTVDYQPALSAS